MIYFTGDINLTDWNFNVGFGIGTNISKGLDPFKHINRKSGDIWIGNFEGVVSSVSSNKGINSKAFRVEPFVLTNLNHMDYYGLANNHVMEHGPAAYLETISSLESYGSHVFGTVEKKSVIFEYKHQTVSISGLSLRIESSGFDPLYWYNPEYKDIINELNVLPKNAFKILFVHWGNEYINRPSISQRKFAHWLLDYGFDLIIGMHPHVLQGYENYNGKRIYYSLGNCVFDMPSEQCKIGAIIGLDFYDSRPVYNEQYLKIDNDCCPHVVTENEIPPRWKFDYLNETLKIEDNSEEYHNEMTSGYLVYRKANHRQLLVKAFQHPKLFYGIFTDFIKRRIFK